MCMWIFFWIIRGVAIFTMTGIISGNPETLPPGSVKIQTQMEFPRMIIISSGNLVVIH